MINLETETDKENRSYLLCVELAKAEELEFCRVCDKYGESKQKLLRLTKLNSSVAKGYLEDDRLIHTLITYPDVVDRLAKVLVYHNIKLIRLFRLAFKGITRQEMKEWKRSLPK